MDKPLWAQRGLHVIAKPIGPVCNLRCTYCFYLEKESLYPAGEPWRMSDQTLEAYVRQYVEAQPEIVEEISFAFQGGEPTLVGLDFFRRAVELQKQYLPAGKRIRNCLQTNGLLLDDRWCEFLQASGFLVGLSLDGPEDLHNAYRRDRNGRGTFAGVMRALARLQAHGVEFNVLACVNRRTGDHPLRVYRFFRDHGVEFVQFIPVVRRLRHGGAQTGGQEVAGPASAERPATPESVDSLVSPESVLPGQFGGFLIGVFDEWLHRDVGKVFVSDFDQALASWIGVGPSLCVYQEECGRAMALEHNGDLYACDHFVDAPHRLGNIHQTPIAELANSPRQAHFGRKKSEALPGLCRRCEVRFACRGACPKDRFLKVPDGEPGLNYLCAGLKEFFTHIDPWMEAMAAAVRAGRPAAVVMRTLQAERRAARDASLAQGPLGRNDPCPCGSGRKSKNCCMRGASGELDRAGRR
jgi:uncharacterized protein